ncbi:PREDICTED: uncharacterized protein LOC105360354 [Ceratosolen solmsi marchali]|uniref:Uncharacterized protein LOC105360354 n=1 Tax=Ceratosolen solmsi marchali TaxID=326594 RepID=A0AAJ6VNZ5_9HYME|nr:PREDICTED: uncharacterized protein LOC105360354 [Ceratosolen solmsi marchali]
MFALLSIYLIILWSQRDFLFTEALVGNTNNVRFILENEYPPVACIAEYNTNPTLGMTFICTGVFISSTHVLTVEHCLYNIQSNKVQVLVGPGELSRSVTYSSIWWISFNQWASSNHLLPVISNNDISIIKKRKVSYY